MNAIDIVKEGLAVSENGQFDKFADLLSDDFVFAGPVPQPIGKREFVGLQTALVQAMPDWKFNASNFMVNGDLVTAMLQITGTQTAELDLPMPGFQKFPPTGKYVSLPAQETRFTVKNGKISRVEADEDPNAGVAGILSQLGIRMPQM